MTAFNYEMMAALLRETEQEHAKVEKSLPKHDWQDWYAAYMVERMRGERYSRELAAETAVSYTRDKSVMAQRIPVGVICDECNAEVPATGSLISPCHEVSCSLHPGNVV